MNKIILLAVTFFLSAVHAVNYAPVGVSVANDENEIQLSGAHFRAVIDLEKGGLISSLGMFDGLKWNPVIDDSVKAFPYLSFTAEDKSYALSDAELLDINKHDGDVFVTLISRFADQHKMFGPLKCRLVYQFCPEGAVFVDFYVECLEETFSFDKASICFEVTEKVVNADYFRNENIAKEKLIMARPSARIAFGQSPAISFTNEVEVVVQDGRNIAGEPGFINKGGSYKWILSQSKTRLVSPGVYHNTAAMGLGAGIKSTQKSSVIGQRIYHWINFASQPGAIMRAVEERMPEMTRGEALDLLKELSGKGAKYWVSNDPDKMNEVLDAIQENAKDCDRIKALAILNAITDQESWYPSNKEIDLMAQNYGSILLLHHEWMQNRGSNGNPHADYSIPRDEKELVRMIKHAHSRGIKVGLYMRGVEDYALSTMFFEKYLTKDYDGIYADWHGFTGRAVHEYLQPVEVEVHDMHYSPDGTYLPAKQYMQFTRKLRNIVGDKGFLIGHQGSMNTGVLSNLGWDADTPGEAGPTRDMFSGDVHEAVYDGFLAGNVVTPWPEESADFRSPMGAAKMAGWGFFPQILMGFNSSDGTELFSRRADASNNQWVWPYWEILSKYDWDNAEILNSPSDARRVFKCNNSSISVIGYKFTDGRILVIAANISDTAARNVEISFECNNIKALLSFDKIQSWGIKERIIDRN
ncbi:hypothetical protein [Limihaloglobus sulfuriphilus]|uniref:hypothetical protein n=1 Tax=Limihaloglobus sulfuriphilus TaxID=1851148 RepID=UPI0011BAA0E1|nr:hypothetical protein [Limihaloglobus sulfuriphilus]